MFKLHTVGSAKTAPIEYIMGTTSEDISLGEALYLSSGKLTKASGTTAPEFIAVGSGNGVIIPVIRIMEDMEFETVFSADASDVAEGSKVTLGSDGLTATATTTSGVFAISKKLGTGASGTGVRGYFRR